jgi:hypothetical protein
MFFLKPELMLPVLGNTSKLFGKKLTNPKSPELKTQDFSSNQTLPTFTILFLFTITFARQTYLTASIP